jgi:hypothetical protein
MSVSSSECKSLLLTSLSPFSTSLSLPPLSPSLSPLSQATSVSRAVALSESPLVSVSSLS